MKTWCCGESAYSIVVCISTGVRVYEDNRLIETHKTGSAYPLGKLRNAELLRAYKTKAVKCFEYPRKKASPKFLEASFSHFEEIRPYVNESDVMYW